MLRQRRWCAALALGFFISSALGCRAQEAPPLETKASAPLASAAPAQLADPAGTGVPRAQERVVRAASLELIVADVTNARMRVNELVKRQGGFVKTSEVSQTDSEALEHAQLVLRVPVAHFDETLRGLSQFAQKVSRESTSSEDVTEEHVDLVARIEAKRRVEARYLTILEKAQNVKEVLEVERELGNLRVELEQLEGRRSLLAARTAFSTIELTLVREHGRVTASLTALGANLTQAGIDSVNGLASVTIALVRAFGYVLPFLLVFGVPGYWFARRIRAERSRQRAALSA